MVKRRNFIELGWAAMEVVSVRRKDYKITIWRDESTARGRVVGLSFLNFSSVS